MATNLAIEDALINQAVKVGHHKTKKDAVTCALQEYIQHRKQLEIISAFRTIEYDRNYNYKTERRKN